MHSLPTQFHRRTTETIITCDVSYFFTHVFYINNAIIKKMKVELTNPVDAIFHESPLAVRNLAEVFFSVKLSSREATKRSLVARRLSRISPESEI